MKHLSTKRPRPCYSEYHPFHLGLLYSDFISFYHLKYPHVRSELVGLAEQNVIFDGFAHNLAQKNNSLAHYLLSNPAYDLIVQMPLQGSIFHQILSHISRVSSIDQRVLPAIVYKIMDLNPLIIFMHMLNDSFSSLFKRFKPYQDRVFVFVLFIVGFSRYCPRNGHKASLFNRVFNWAISKFCMFLCFLTSSFWTPKYF